jgi:hypothetical protein
VTVLLGECFDCSFTTDHCGDDLALLGILLGADQDKVVGVDDYVHHGIS